MARLTDRLLYALQSILANSERLVASIRRKRAVARLDRIVSRITERSSGGV